jgi:hypothetical protein
MRIPNSDVRMFMNLVDCQPKYADVIRRGAFFGARVTATM